MEQHQEEKPKKVKRVEVYTIQYEREWELYRKNKNKILEIRKKKNLKLYSRRCTVFIIILVWKAKRKSNGSDEINHKCNRVD